MVYDCASVRLITWVTGRYIVFIVQDSVANGENGADSDG